MKDFWATEASHRMIIIAYDLMSLFRQIVLKTKSQATLNTLRFKCFALGAWISKHAGKRVLKISLTQGRRTWLDGLFSTIDDISPPYKFSNA